MASTSAAPVIVFFCTHHKGHFKPLLALVERFVAAGCRVVFVAPTSVKVAVEALGARHEPYKGDDAWSLHASAVRVTEQELKCEVDAPIANDFLFVQVLPATLDVLAFCVELLKAESPALVVYDSACAWAKLAARLVHVRAVSSCSSTIMAPPEREAVLGFLRERAEVKKAVAVLKEKWGLAYDPVNAYTNYEEEDGGVTVVWSIRELQPHAADVPYARYLGSAVLPVAPKKWGDFPSELLDTDKKVVYMSMGTVVGTEGWTVCTLPVFQRAVDVFRERRDVLLVLSVGPNLTAEDVASSEPLPAHVHVFSHVPQVAVLHKAFAFVTHLGNGGFNEALFASTPLLGLPVFGDQNMNAETTLRLGLGECIKSPFAPAPAENLDHITRDALRERFAALEQNYAQYVEGVARVRDKLMEKRRYLHEKAVAELLAGREVTN